jgi:RNase H-fold protein (predicted Holliday junction resolvase)
MEKIVMQNGEAQWEKIKTVVIAVVACIQFVLGYFLHDLNAKFERQDQATEKVLRAVEQQSEQINVLENKQIYMDAERLSTSEILKRLEDKIDLNFTQQNELRKDVKEIKQRIR